MKNILVGLVALTLAVAFAAPASAIMFPWPQTSNDVVITNSNNAHINNDVTAIAKTGDNEIEGGRGGIIRTGDAYADALADNTVNTNDTKVVAPCTNCNGDVTVANLNTAKVKNDVTAVADTGDNEIEGGRTRCHSNGGKIITGDSTSYATAINVINTNVTRIRR